MLSISQSHHQSTIYNSYHVEFIQLYMLETVALADATVCTMALHSALQHFPSRFLVILAARSEKSSEVSQCWEGYLLGRNFPNIHLVSGFNPFQKYGSNWVHLPQIGMKVKIV